MAFSTSGGKQTQTQKDRCDICYDGHVASFFEDEIACKEEVINFFPGSEGSLTLNRHLRVYFIITRLLKLHGSQFIKLFLRQPSWRENGNDGGNKLLYTSVCRNCDQIVNEAVNLHQKIGEMQKRIDELGKRLLELNEIGKKLDKQSKKRKVKFNYCEKTAEKMLDLSLACLQLGGTRNTTTLKDSTSKKKRSIKEALRKRKPSSKTTTSHSLKDVLLLKSEQMESKPLGEDAILTVDTMKNNFQNNEEPKGTDKLIGENIKGLQGEQKIENVGEEFLDVTWDGVEGIEDSNEVDIPDDDGDYIPTQSTDEEFDDDEDLDYIPESVMTEKKIIEGDFNTDCENEMEESVLDSEDDDGVEVVGGSGGGENQNTEWNNNDEVDIRNVTSTMYEYRCPECPQIFPRRQSLHLHTKRAHGVDTLYLCPKCPGLKFRFRKELLNHRNSVHGNVCEKCGKKLHKIGALIDHYKRVHKMSFTFTCPVCKIEFKSLLELRTHRSKAHLQPEKETQKLPPRPPKNDVERFWAGTPCSECGKKYLSAEKLSSHLYSSHESKLSKKFKKENMRKCYFCWKYFTLEQRFWIHHRMSHPDKKLEFPCESCSDKYIVFKSTSELLTHFETDHAQDSIHTCTFCKWPFLDEQALKAHLNGHVHKKEDPDITDAKKVAHCKFNCWFCWELFPTEEKRQIHIKKSTRHRKNFKYEFPCDDFDCDHNQNPFSNLAELTLHLEEAHKGKQTFTCDRCNWSFLTNGMFTLHKLNHIPRRASQFKCPSCEHISAYQSSLKDHYNNYHGVKMKHWRCDKCEERFVTKKGVILHRNQAHKNYEELAKIGVPCDKCGKMFKNENAVKLHQYSYHKDLKCPECGMNFQATGKLTLHRRRKHNVGIQHLCTVCGKTFFEKGLLIKHMVYHSEKKRFECHLCGKMMLKEETLKKHYKRLHENYKPSPNQPFVCTICGIGYTRKDTLDDHMRVKHTKEGYRVWECNLCGKRFKRQNDLTIHTGSSKGCNERVFLKDIKLGTTVNSSE